MGPGHGFALLITVVEGRVGRLGGGEGVEPPLLRNSNSRPQSRGERVVRDELEEMGPPPFTLSGGESQVTVLSRGGTGPDSRF